MDLVIEPLNEQHAATFLGAELAMIGVGVRKAICFPSGDQCRLELPWTSTRRATPPYRLSNAQTADRRAIAPGWRWR